MLIELVGVVLLVGVLLVCWACGKAAWRSYKFHKYFHPRRGPIMGERYGHRPNYKVGRV